MISLLANLFQNISKFTSSISNISNITSNITSNIRKSTSKADQGEPLGRTVGILRTVGRHGSQGLLRASPSPLYRGPVDRPIFTDFYRFLPIFTDFSDFLGRLFLVISRVFIHS